MIAYPEMLKKAATLAGISVPDNVDNYLEYMELYPHFYMFCEMQLGQPMPYASVHFDNAHVIAKYSEEEILETTVEELMENGFQIGYSN